MNRLIWPQVRLTFGSLILVNNHRIKWLDKWTISKSFSNLINTTIQTTNQIIQQLFNVLHK